MRISDWSSDVCSSDLIVDLILELLAETPPELSKDIHGQGILLTGGGAATPALREKIEAGTGLHVAIAEDSGLCVARGLFRLKIGRASCRERVCREGLI